VSANETKWGRRGSKIEGSVYVRDFCRLCFDPIRVSKAVIGNASPVCSGCKQHNRSCGSWNKAVWSSDQVYHGSYSE